VSRPVLSGLLNTFSPMSDLRLPLQSLPDNFSPMPDREGENQSRKSSSGKTCSRTRVSMMVRLDPFRNPQWREEPTFQLCRAIPPDRFTNRHERLLDWLEERQTWLDSPAELHRVLELGYSNLLTIFTVEVLDAMISQATNNKAQPLHRPQPLVAGTSESASRSLVLLSFISYYVFDFSVQRNMLQFFDTLYTAKRADAENSAHHRFVILRRLLKQQVQNLQLLLQRGAVLNSGGDGAVVLLLAPGLKPRFPTGTWQRSQILDEDSQLGFLHSPQFLVTVPALFLAIFLFYFADWIAAAATIFGGLWLARQMLFPPAIPPHQSDEAGLPKRAGGLRSRSPASRPPHAVPTQPPVVERKNDCCICGDREANIALVPCGHVIYCSSCLNLALRQPHNGTVCPMCRRQFYSVLRVYL
jgi:hypothetical protein